LPILIVPGSNDGGFEPNRSVLKGSTPAAERSAFKREFRAARATESTDPAKSIVTYRRLLDRHPEFAESHYRLARLLVGAGATDGARRHFILARDLDGLPLRCPTDFRAAFPAVARRHDAVLIDGPEVLARISPHGILDDHIYHDAQHLNLAGTVALAQEILEALYRRRAFGWPETTPVPRIDLEECARHFGLDARKWSTICERSAVFYAMTAFVRYDPTERQKMMDEYIGAARELVAGRRPVSSRPLSLDMSLSLLRDAQPLSASSAIRAE
jgi:hypothetical protein